MTTLAPSLLGIVCANLLRSHPDSSNYGKHYSPEAVIELFKPHDDTVSAVREWLHSAGIDPEEISQSANRQWLQFDAKVADVEELFKARFHMYEHKTGKMTIGCDEYHVPGHLTDSIDYITPGIKLSVSNTKRPSEADIEKRTFGWVSRSN